MRPTWDETWMNVARSIALRSSCSRAKIGAVIVDPTNRIVATGYNNSPAGYERSWVDECDGREGGYCPRGKFGPNPDSTISYSDCSTIHAEANALMFCDRRDRLGGTIYVTEVMCFTCSKLVANSGLARAVVIDRPDWKYRLPSNSIDFLRASGIKVDVIEEYGRNEPQDTSSGDSESTH